MVHLQMAACYPMDGKGVREHETLGFQTAKELRAEQISQGSRDLSCLLCHCNSHLASSTLERKKGT